MNLFADKSQKITPSFREIVRVYTQSQAKTKPIRICGQCTHFNGNFQMPRCTRVQIQNLVDGRNMDADCHPERNKGTQCGPDGKLFNLKRSAA